MNSKTIHSPLQIAESILEISESFFVTLSREKLATSLKLLHDLNLMMLKEYKKNSSKVRKKMNEIFLAIREITSGIATIVDGMVDKKK